MGATAQAALLNVNTGGTLSSTLTNTTTTTTGLLGGVVGGTVTTVVNGVVCPTLSALTTTLAQTPLLGDGLGAIGAGVTSLVCASGLLEYKIVTTYKRPDGSLLTRTFNATVGVPTPLNVDDDALNDLTGTISLTGLNSIGFQVNRDPLKPTANLPVKVEAVIGDGSTLVLGRRYLSFGYDARMDNAPGGFTLDTPLDTITRPGGDFRINVSQTQRRSRLAVVAGLFDGTPTSRVNPTEATIDYGASPDTATIVARAGSDTAVTLTTNRPGPTGISGRVVKDATTDRFDAQVNDLPGSLSVAANTQNGTQATYSASARVASIDGTLQRTVNSVLTQKTRLTLSDVPTGINATVNGNQFNVSTTGGPIGLTKIGQANGEPKFLSDSEPAYVYSDDNGTLKSIAAKIPGLSSATANLGSAPTVSAQIASTPLLARLIDPQRSLDARVRNLPAKFDLGLNLAGGSLSYNGYGQGIAKITLDGSAVSSAPFFARATKLKGTLEGIPASLTGTLETGQGKGGITLSNAIGKVELIASNGPEALPAGAGQGAIYRDLPGGDYLVAARVLGVKQITFDTSSQTALRAVTAGGPFSVEARLPSLTLDGQVQDLPPDASLGFDQANQKLTFTGRKADGSPQGINTLDLTASNPAGTLVGRADRLRAHVEGIPADLALAFNPSGGAVNVTASNPIAKIEVAAANRQIDFTAGGDLPAGTTQGARFTDTTSTYALGARILGLRKISASTANNKVVLSAQTAGGPFALDVTTNTLTGNAQILDLPADLDATLDLPNGKLTVNGNGQGIAKLTADVHSSTALFGRATDIHANVEDIPSALTLDIAQGGNGASVVANAPIGLVELVAANHTPDLSTDLPVNNEQGAKLIDHAGGDYTIGARIRQLQKLSASFAGPITISTKTEGGPFGVRVSSDDIEALARIENLPDQLDASLDLDAGKLIVNGNGQGIDKVTLDATSATPLFGRASNVHALITDIPSALTLDIAQNGSGANVQASDPIGLIELVASNRAIVPSTDLPVNNEQGAKLTDLTNGEYTVAARIRQLQKLSASFAGPITLSTKTAGGPFGVRVTTDTLRALARVEDLPAQLDASIDLDAGKLVINGNGQSIDRITLDADSDSPLFGRASDVHALVEDIPSALTLDIAQSGSGANIDASDPIGLVELAAADHDLADPSTVLPAAGEQGAVFRDTTSTFELGARIRQLKSVHADLAGVVGIQAKTAGGPFSVVAQTDDLDANARFQDLPADVDATFDPSGGALTYHGKNASGDPVGTDLVTVDVTGDTPLFDRANRISVRIEQLAPDVVFTIDPAGPSANVNASQPVGKLEFLATNIPSNLTVPEIPDGEQGAIYHDKTGQPFVLSARLLDLENIAFGLGSGEIGISSKLRSTPFSVDLMTDDLDAAARIANLPAQTQLGINLDDGTFSYKGFDGSGDPVGVDSITFDASSDQPLFGRARVLKGELLQVPSEINVGFNTAAGGASVAIPGGNLGSLALLVSDGQNTALPTDQSVLYHDNANEFRIAAKVVGLKQLDADFQDALGLRVVRTQGSRFTADIDVANALQATADIQDLPADATFGLDLDGTSTTNPNALTFKGRDENGNPKGIGVLDLTASAATPIFGAGQYIQGHIEQLPSDVELGFSQDNGKASVKTVDPANPTALGPPVGKIELAASDTAGQFDYPTDNGNPVQGAILHTKTGDPFRIGIRINQLQKLDVDFAQAINLSSRTAGGVFLADVDTDGFSANARIDQLPTQLDLGLDLDNGELSYQGNSPINEISASIHSATELFLGATDVGVDLKSVPTNFTIALPSSQTGSLDSLNLSTTGTPIGQIDITAHSPNRAAPALPAGQAGASFDSTGGELGLALRVFGLKALNFSLDPLSLHSEMDAGHTFVVDAKLDQKDDNGNVTGTTAAQATIDKLPSNVTLSLADLPGSTPQNPLGSRLSLVGNARINLVKLATQGLELLEGADHIDAQIEDLPQGLTLDLPTAGTGQPLAVIKGFDANNNPSDIGQIRLAAGSGSVTAPADTYNLATRTATGNDQLNFDQTANFSVATRLTAVKSLSLNLDPINISLGQDAARNRPISLDAKIPNPDNSVATVTGTLNKPAASTSMSVVIQPGQPSKLIFDDSANIGQFDLNALNLGSIPQLELHLTNLAPKLSVCFDGGGLCRRANPNLLPGTDSSNPARNGNSGGMNRPYPALASMDFEDFNTQTSGFTVLNAKIKQSATAPQIVITNLRFFNLGFDLGTGPEFSNTATGFQPTPRLYMFFDSRNKQFVMEEIKYPPTISSFRIGTTGSPAIANNRIAWLKGPGGFLNQGFSKSSAGTMNCGGQKVMNISVGGFFDINALTWFGGLVDLC